MSEDEFELDAETRSYVDRLVSGLEINPDFADSTAVFYRQYEKLLKREIRETARKKIVAMSALKASCRRHRTPVTFDELITVSGEKISRKELSKAYNGLVRTLGLKIPPARPQDYIPRFRRKLKLDEDFETVALKMLEQAESLGYDYSGKIPEGVAAGTIYLAATLSETGAEMRTLEDIDNYLGISTVTTRERARDLAEKLGFEPHYPFIQKKR